MTPSLLHWNISVVIREQNSLVLHPRPLPATLSLQLINQSCHTGLQVSWHGVGEPLPVRMNDIQTMVTSVSDVVDTNHLSYIVHTATTNNGNKDIWKFGQSL